MATFTDTFERKETKYRLTAQQYTAMLNALSGRMVLDEYGRARVTSLYFDTPDRSLISRSLEKPLYKEKLRVRWYNRLEDDTRVYIEIKKKFDGIVYKRRVGCSRGAMRAFLTQGMPYEQACERFPLANEEERAEAVAPRSLQISREISQFMEAHRPLTPSMYIMCERTAYASPAPMAEREVGEAGSDLRITFDSGIAYRDVRAQPGVRAGYRPLLALGDVIMEVKTAFAFPLWLVEALSGCEAYPSSFSKYGAAYEACTRRARPAAARAAEGAGGHAAGAGSARMLRFRTFESVALQGRAVRPADAGAGAQAAGGAGAVGAHAAATGLAAIPGAAGATAPAAPGVHAASPAHAPVAHPARTLTDTAPLRPMLVPCPADGRLRAMPNVTSRHFHAPVPKHVRREARASQRLMKKESNCA